MRIILKNLLTALRRFPTAVLLNVGGLSVAFAAFLIILMQVRFEYGFDRFHPHADRIFRVELCEEGSFATSFNQPLIDELTASSAHIVAGSLYGLGNSHEADFKVERPNGMQDVFRIECKSVYPSLVEVLGMELVEGDASVLNTSDQVLIPLSLARRLFPDSPATGHILLRESGDLTVGGVYRDFPANSVFPNHMLIGHPWRNSRGNYNYLFFVRLDEPASAQDVQRVMHRKVREFMAVTEDEPETAVSVRLVNVRDIYYEQDVDYEIFTQKGSRKATGILLAIALLVIVIAAINFINFASALAPVRMKMVNLQKILGAGVWQLRASLLFEAAVISLAAYLIALWMVAAIAATPFAQYLAADLSLGANLPLIGQCSLVALCVGLAAGLYPALYMTSFRPILAVRGSFGTSPAGRRYRMALVGLQYVISLALIVATLFVNLQNRYLTDLDMGYDRDRIVVVTLSGDLMRKSDLLTQRLKTDAAIEDAAFAYGKFGGEEVECYMGWGRSYKDFKDGISYNVLLVTDNFPRVLGIPVTEGRDFTPSDTRREPCSYIFNRIARERFGMQTGDYIGQREYDGEGRHSLGWGEIIGFFTDSVRFFSQYRAEEPLAFVVMGEQNRVSAVRYCYIRLADNADPMAAVNRIRRTLDELSPFEQQIEFMDTVANALYQNEVKAGVLVTSFSLLAILVSLTGVFGLVLFETQYRRKEIGIRKVNGATSGSILWMFNRRFAAIVCVSFLIAAPVARYGVGLWLRNFRSAMPLSAWVFAAALAAVLLITVVTVTVRSWHTANENPVKSVKTE